MFLKNNLFQSSHNHGAESDFFKFGSATLNLTKPFFLKVALFIVRIFIIFILFMFANVIHTFSRDLINGTKISKLKNRGKLFRLLQLPLQMSDSSVFWMIC